MSNIEPAFYVVVQLDWEEHVVSCGSTNGGDVEDDLDRLRCVTVALSRGGQFLPKREFVGVSGVGS